MDSIHGGFGKLQTEVGTVSLGMAKVNKTVSKIAEGQVAVASKMGNFDEKMDLRFEEAAQSAKSNAERVEQSGDEVLQVLRKVERNSQRGIWIFATLLAILFIALDLLLSKDEPVNFRSGDRAGSGGLWHLSQRRELKNLSFRAAEPAAEVLVDDFEF